MYSNNMPLEQMQLLIEDTCLLAASAKHDLSNSAGPGQISLYLLARLLVGTMCAAPGGHFQSSYFVRILVGSRCKINGNIVY